ncbi:MAG: efflux RND transporter periplasmic adaptor subunit [Sandaracinaceae bacterium]
MLPRPSLLLVALVALAACDPPWAPQREEEPAPPRLVVAEEVVVDDAVDQVVLLGDLHGRREVSVFSPMPERIRVLHVQEGDPVEAGDPIATLDATMQVTGVAQARAALAAAEASRDQLQADVARAERLVARGAAPETQLLAAQAQLRAAEAQVEQLAAARRSAGEQRDRTIIRAPIDGTVALLRLEQGDLAAPSAPLCRVVQMNPMDVHVRVTEQDFVRLRTGMAVRVAPPALPEAEREGTLHRISPVLDPVTRTATVEIEVPNEDGRLRPGMVAEVAIVLDRRAGVLLAPARALLLGERSDEERQADVFVVAEGRAERRSIAVGQRYGDRVEVTGGLEAGDRVVVRGQHLLRDGAAVRTGRLQDQPLAQGAGS